MSEQTAEVQDVTTAQTPTAVTGMEITPNPSSDGANQQPEVGEPSTNHSEGEPTPSSPEASTEVENPADETQEAIADIAERVVNEALDPTVALEAVANIDQLQSFREALFELAKTIWLSEGGIEGISQDRLTKLRQTLEKQKKEMLEGSLNWEEFASKLIAEAGENNPRLKALGLEIQKAALQEEIKALEETSGGESESQDNEALQQAEAKIKQVEEELKKLKEDNPDLANLDQLQVLYKMLTGKDFDPENPNLDAIPIALARAAMTQEARENLMKRLEENLAESPEAKQFIDSLNSTLDEIQKNAPDIEKILTILKRKERLKAGMGIILLLLIALGLITYKTAAAEEKS